MSARILPLDKDNSRLFYPGRGRRSAWTPVTRRSDLPGYVWIIDLFGLVLAIAGFTMAFRQDMARRIIGRPRTPAKSVAAEEEGGDPLTYVLRIAGVM